MIHLMKKLLAAAMVGVLFAGPAHAADLRIGVEGAYPPFSEVNEKGELVGFDIDIARALCAEMKVECELVQQDWDGIIPALQAKKYDAIIASMSATEERRKEVDFTGHYYKAGAKFVRKKGSGIRVSYKGLAGKSVGVQRGTVTDNFVSEKFEGAEVKRYGELTDAYADMLAGRLDLLMADAPVVGDWVKNNPDYELTGQTYTTSEYFDEIAIAVRIGEEELRDKLSAAILAIRANGKYKEINDKYFDFDLYGR